jgi:hypothetical protein
MTPAERLRMGHSEVKSPWPIHIRKTKPEATPRSSYCTNTNTGFDAIPFATTSSLQIQGSWTAGGGDLNQSALALL